VLGRGEGTKRLFPAGRGSRGVFLFAGGVPPIKRQKRGGILSPFRKKKSSVGNSCIRQEKAGPLLFYTGGEGHFSKNGGEKSNRQGNQGSSFLNLKGKKGKGWLPLGAREDKAEKKIGKARSVCR